MGFATAEDVATRLDRSFTDSEVSMAELLCDAATVVIADAAGKSDAWADALDPVPQMLRFLAIELVARVMPNPEGAASISEQLGAYQYTKNFRGAAGVAGLMLTDVETLLVRRVVHGRTSGSVKVDSHVTEVYDLIYGS